jgi:hypothetical protein
MYGNKLQPTRTLRRARGIKGLKQHVSVTNNPSTIDQNQMLTVRFPNLFENDVVVPGTSRLAFNIKLSDKASTIVNNIGRSIVKKLVVKIEGSELISIDDYDKLMCYWDLWKTKDQRADCVYQGICGDNLRKLRVGTEGADETNAEDKALSKMYGNRFCIPLDFELLESSMPFHQSGLEGRLMYEITFNKYGSIIVGEDKTASYTIDGITLEYEVVTNDDLAGQVKRQYMGCAVFYDRVLRHRTVLVDKKDSLWNWGFNTPAKSLKGILVLFEDESDYSVNSEKFYNPKIKRVSVTVEGQPNQLFSGGMLPHHQWDEIRKGFGGGRLIRYGNVMKELGLSDVEVGEYATDKYALWLDFRTTDDNELHGSGRRVENASEGVTLQIEKDSESAGKLRAHMFLFMDAQLNIVDGGFGNVLY